MTMACCCCPYCAADGERDLLSSMTVGLMLCSLLLDGNLAPQTRRLGTAISSSRFELTFTRHMVFGHALPAKLKIACWLVSFFDTRTVI